MSKKREPTESLYGTKQVAEILEIPEWRVKNFAEGEAYGLPPTQKIGTGRGSRRLYNIVDVLRIAIASELVTAGFAPESVGKAVREIPESKLTSWDEDIDRAREVDLGLLPLLVCVQGEWRVRKLKEVRSLLESKVEYIGTGDVGGVFILNFLNLIAAVQQDIEEGLGQK